ncbi:hypothetical protein P170DRAFT_432375 [Aspergillus steynii IBT 23096]|uniref:BZIP domain-containing protein n=1 Tax=Aspergillus steynii IBT 23096 TaxID=1392250 RepID=A0A2I2GPJ3_9EURO|nr:uncharacterized protein P170DRAFT_432375 [Aspergillus steynii IBT 23096]PLB54794.1 hypothetical protein P170DRAFT_432375 [Aspergillus steynii IBT 23096]
MNPTTAPTALTIPTPNTLEYIDQDTGPAAPISAFSRLRRSSPAIPTASAPRSSPSFTPYRPLADPISHVPSISAGQKRPRDQEAESSMGEPHPRKSHRIGVRSILNRAISSSQEGKRKASNDASQRLRNRTRRETELEEKIITLQDEVQKQSEALQQQAQDIRVLRAGLLSLRETSTATMAGTEQGLLRDESM